MNVLNDSESFQLTDRSENVTIFLLMIYFVRKEDRFPPKARGVAA